MILEILHKKTLFENGFGALYARLGALEFELRTQSIIVQNDEVRISEEEFISWWNNQIKFIEELKMLEADWKEIHKIVAENRHEVGTPLPGPRLR